MCVCRVGMCWEGYVCGWRVIVCVGVCECGVGRGIVCAGGRKGGVYVWIYMWLYVGICG